MSLRSLVFACCLASAAGAQEAPSDTVGPVTTVDVRLLRAVVDVDAPVFVGAMRGVNASAYPVFLGAAPVAWGAAYVAGADAGPALRLTLAEGGAVGLTFALKNLVRRPRPYAALPGVRARDRGHQRDDVFDPHSFPSGHASVAFSVATSLSLSYPEWYVIGPAAAWAGGMAVTRVWHGVHYPTDVLVGAALGASAAVLVHVLVPDSDGPDGDGLDCGPCAVVPVGVVIPL